MNTNQNTENPGANESEIPASPELTSFTASTASRIAVRMDDTHESMTLPALAPLIPSLSAPLVLIADDEVAVRKSIRLVMEISGYRVEEVTRGMQVLACLHHSPAVVLLDINMPGLNGVECLAEIRKRRPHMKVIIVSGEIDAKMGTLKELGAFAYIPKPVDAYKLIAAVKRAIDDQNAAGVIAKT